MVAALKRLGQRHPLLIRIGRNVNRLIHRLKRARGG